METPTVSSFVWAFLAFYAFIHMCKSKHSVDIQASGNTRDTCYSAIISSIWTTYLIDFPMIAGFPVPGGNRNWSVHCLLSSAFQGKTCFSPPSPTRAPSEAVIAVLVGDRGRREKWGCRRKSELLSLQVLKSGPNMGIGTRPKVNLKLLGKPWWAGFRKQDGLDLKITVKSTSPYHFLCANMYKCFSGVLSF